uniref:Immunoglobulin V-set domain-containing protein n=1 Tax=Marmota marmota marmota TaxID=9994 RepID=A0A8C5ZFT6_MARMA
MEKYWFPLHLSISNRSHLLFSKYFLDSSSSCLDGQSFIKASFSHSPCVCMHVCPVTTSLSVQMGTKVVLYCPCIPLTRVLITTWRIRFRNKPSCKIAHDRETNQTIETNCVDRRITWASRPDQSPHLQIYATAITHDGYFRCQMATYHGNFRREYHLQVLGKESVVYSPGQNRTGVLKAVADNDTVAAGSMCHSSDRHVSIMTCLVSHLTGNRSLSIDLLPGLGTPESPGSTLLIILYAKLSLLVVILVMVGFAFFQRINDCR